MKRLMMLAVLLLGVWGMSAAQDGAPLPNDPAVNEDANACYEGGSMEGKCGLDADGDGTLEQHELDWAWACGWYAIRIEAGMIPASGLPAWCGAAQPEIPANCYNHTGGGSVLYIGPANTINNMMYFFEDNCVGDAYVYGDTAIIITDDEKEATAICLSFTGAGGVYQMSTQGWLTPTNFWECTAAVVPPGA